EQTTYEIARTIEKIVVAPGETRRLSIAVLLDVPVVDGKRAPRSDEELERIKRLVASGSGVRAERDEVEVLQVPFDPNLGMGADTASGKGSLPSTVSVTRPFNWVMVAAGAGLALV